MYSCPKFYGSSPYNFRENDLNAKTQQNFAVSELRKVGQDSVFMVGSGFSSRCIHDLSFMALALTVSEKMA